MLLDSPLFLVLLAELIVFGKGLNREDPRLRWLFAIMAIAIPFSAICARQGRRLAQLFAARALADDGLLRDAAAKICSSGWRAVRGRFRSRLLLGSFLAVLLLMTMYPHLKWENALIVQRSRWDKDYRETLAVAGKLPGTVVCPEDPTIPFYGNGYVGLNLFSEKDARASQGSWPEVMPELILDEMRKADFVVDIREYWGENVDDALLESLGFEAMEVASLDPSCYQIWRKTNRHIAEASADYAERIGRSEGVRRPTR